MFPCQLELTDKSLIPASNRYFSIESPLKLSITFQGKVVSMVQKNESAKAE